MRADLEPKRFWRLSGARWGRRALMCRQADYSQPDCVLFSDKCSAINESCVSRRSANVAVTMAMTTTDCHKAIQRAEKEPGRTSPTGMDLSTVADWRKSPRAPTPLRTRTPFPQTWRWVGVWCAWPSGPSPTGTNWCQVPVSRRIKLVCFAFTSGAENKTASTRPHGSQRPVFEARTGRRRLICSANLC